MYRVFQKVATGWDKGTARQWATRQVKEFRQWRRTDYESGEVIGMVVGGTTLGLGAGITAARCDAGYVPVLGSLMVGTILGGYTGWLIVASWPALPVFLGTAAAIKSFTPRKKDRGLPSGK